MKEIEATKETVTLELSWKELCALDIALGDASFALERESGELGDLIHRCVGDDRDEVLIYEAGREEETLEELKQALKRVSLLLPAVYDLSESLGQIMKKEGQ